MCFSNNNEKEYVLYIRNYSAQFHDAQPGVGEAFGIDVRRGEKKTPNTVLSYYNGALLAAVIIGDAPHLLRGLPRERWNAGNGKMTLLQIDNVTAFFLLFFGCLSGLMSQPTERVFRGLGSRRASLLSSYYSVCYVRQASVWR